MIIYELLEGKEPFTCGEMDKLLLKVGDKMKTADIWKIALSSGKRPKFEKFKILAFQEICKECWRSNPNERPSIKSILEKSNKILLDIFESCCCSFSLKTPNDQKIIADEFWKTTFGNETSVDRKDFGKKFCNFMHVRKPTFASTKGLSKYKAKIQILEILFGKYSFQFLINSIFDFNIY